MSKRSSKSKRRSRSLPALGFAGVTLSMASGACASTSEATANTPPISPGQNHEIFLGEEEIFDVSLSTFHPFDKENGEAPPIAQHLILARGGGCGSGHGAGCGHGGGGVHVGCGGSHGGCRGCGRGLFRGCGGGGCGCGGGGEGCGGGGCGGGRGNCWYWSPALGWSYICWSESTPPAEVAAVASEPPAQTAEIAVKGDRNTEKRTK
jgi:hypothetical protein